MKDMKKIALVLLGCVACGIMAYAQDFGGFGGGLEDFGITDIPGLSGAAADPAAEESRIRTRMAMMAFDSRIALCFANALNAKPVPDATVEIAGVGTFTTDRDGVISFPQRADGSYNLTVSKRGFITTPITFKIQVGAVIMNWFSISPEMPNRDIRVVLDWGPQPYDLDLHLEKIGAYHISYQNMRTFGAENATLDRDDTRSYGPETITLGRIDRNAAYHLFVRDYSNGRAAASTALSQSGATIRVYSQNRLINTFQVPAGRGTVWSVFRLERGNVTPVNTLGN
jgi:hypothetical protein